MFKKLERIIKKRTKRVNQICDDFDRLQAKIISQSKI